MFLLRWRCWLLSLLACALVASAQQSSGNSSNSAASLPSASTSGNATALRPSRSGFNVSVAVTPTPTATSPVATAAPIVNSAPRFLNSRVTATWGVLATLLLGSGLALMFWGVRSRWSGQFLCAFWSAAMVTILLILQLSVARMDTPPREATQGLYLLACLGAGLVCGTLSAVLWPGYAKFLVVASGAFSLGMFLLALKPDGLIGVYYGRYILLIGFVALAVVGYTFNKLQHGLVLFGTAALGSTITVLGIDCFIVNAHLKEFYIYILGIDALPRRIIYFPHTTGIRVELAVIGALFFVSIAVQMPFLKLLVSKHRERKVAELAEQEKSDLEAARAQKLSGLTLQEWEAKHGKGSDLTLLEKSDGEYLPTLGIGAVTSQPSGGPAPLSAKWADYLKTRSIMVDDRKPKETNNGKRLSVEPLGPGRGRARASKSQAVAVRPVPSQALQSWASPTDSSGSSPSPPMDTISVPRSPSPANALELARHRPGTSMTLARSSSRPVSLAFPSPEDERPAFLGDARRSSTLLNLGPEDMSGASKFYLRPEMTSRRSTGGLPSQPQEERVIVADWRRTDVRRGSQPVARTPSPGPAKIMDLDELEDRKKRRLSQLQAKAHISSPTPPVKSSQRPAQTVDEVPRPRRASLPLMQEMTRSRSAPLHERRETKRVSGIERVDKWKRESSSALQQQAEAPAVNSKPKKTSWLDY